MAEFDPGRMSRRLQAAGASEDLAEAAADEVNGAVLGSPHGRTWRSSGAEMRADMQAFRADMRADMQAFRADMQAFQAEIRAELAAFRVDLQALRAEFQKELRILALQLGGFAVGVAGIAVAIVKLA